MTAVKKQSKLIAILVEFKLFIQNSIDVEGEHGGTRWGSHWAFITVEEEKNKRSTSHIPPQYLTKLLR